MKKIYTGIDLGSYSIKMIVCEVINNNFHVLAASNIRCKGIKDGLVIDTKEAKKCLKKLKQDIEKQLSITINQAIIAISSYDKKFDIVEGCINIDENKIINSSDIKKVLQQAVSGKIDSDNQLVTVTPILFQVDNSNFTKDPKGCVGSTLSTKLVATSVPKDNLKSIASLLKECGIDVVDATFGSIGDYYESKSRNKDLDDCISAIVNIGHSKTEISIFNKGIMIKNKILSSGSKVIDKEIACSYGIKLGQARSLKENFALADTRYADSIDTVELINKDGIEFSINQLEISNMVENSLIDMLKEVKKQINILTNRKISYIIIAGGISNIAGFEYAIENVFDKRTMVLNVDTIGIRDNIYSSCYGIIKYFYNKLDLEDISYSMINENFGYGSGER